MRRFSGGRLGLRARSAVAYALVGLALSVVLSVVTYNRSRSYLLRQRESVAVEQAWFNARLIANALRPSSDPARVVGSVVNTSGSQPLLRFDGRWFVTSANIGPNDLPGDLVRRALSGTATRARFDVRGQPTLAVALPITRGGAITGVYVEASSLAELERTLVTLSAALSVGSVIATSIGALLGLYLSRRMLRPLGTVATTAERIAEGELSARLDDTGDPDLTRIIGSFNRMATSLEERIKRERRFASDVSHELRSPLTALRGAVDLVMARRGDLPDRAQVGIDLLEQQVARFERMVLDLLEIARIEAGSAAVQPELLRLEPLLRSVLAHLGASDVRLELPADAADAKVLVDTRRFERVLANLLENADRHGGGVAAVRVGTSLADARVHVDDAGPGVPEGDRDRVFERFTRGASARHRAGAGLGLALVTEHLRLMGGWVSVGTSPEGGARFTVCLPRQG